MEKLNEELSNLTTKELQDICKQKGISYRYNVKTDLIERLLSVLSAQFDKEKESNETNEDFHDTHETCEVNKKIIGEPEAHSKQNKQINELRDREKHIENPKLKVQNENKNTKVMENSFVFRDVEESLEKFSGESGKAVEVWIKEFEDIATVCNWNDIQKYLYARRLLIGAAKLCIEVKTGVHSWEMLSKTLKDEFTISPLSIDIHRELMKREKRQSETFLEYVFSMQRIANRGNVDAQSLVTYIIQGIPDEVSNKTVLYEATTLEELKKKFLVYQNIKEQLKKHKQKNENRAPGTSYPKQDASKKRCINCGAFTHHTDMCPNKGKGRRCFACNEYGHMSASCPTKKQGEGSRVNRIALDMDQFYVKIEGNAYNALIDTGSDVTLMRRSVKDTCSNLKYDLPGILLRGFGGNTSKQSLGSCLVNLELETKMHLVRFQVVPDQWLTEEIILGKDFLCKLSMLIQNGKITLLKEENVTEPIENPFSKVDVIQLTEKRTIDYVQLVKNDQIRHELVNIIDTYKPAQVEKSCVEMNIVLTDESPVYYKARRLAPKERDFVKEQVEEWLKEGVIEHSQSDFASPIVLVKKKGWEL